VWISQKKSIGTNYFGEEFSEECRGQVDIFLPSLARIERASLTMFP
jgi:hypothetical protein